MYFSKLALHADAAMAARAKMLASSVELADLAALATRLDDLAAKRLSERERVRHAQILGSWLGEYVRERAGGAWGIGRQFAEEIPGALLVGPGALKFWPWHEVRDRIEGRAALPLGERIDRLCERAANADVQGATDHAPRTYLLKAGEGYFEAGVTRDGRQVLMAAHYPATFAIVFATDGAFVEYQERPNTKSEPDTDALAAWQQELGFTPRTIRVHKFELAAQGLGIEDLPGHDEDFLADPDGEPAEDQAERFARIRAWVDSGCFVLYWGNDLWLDGEGNVTSS